MAKKTRKQKQRATRRPTPTVPARPITTVIEAALDGSASVVAASVVDSEPVRAAAPVAAAEGVRRRVERVAPAGPSAVSVRQQRQAAHTSRYAGSSAANIGTLETDDPAIPFDHVPYVPADLRRVAVMASVMVVLILIAWGVVSLVVS
jgi:hypothetical protein